MPFRDTNEISQELSKIFREIQELPKVSCNRCGTVYRGEKEPFVCINCIEKENQEIEAKREKAYEIETLLNVSNIPKRYRRAIFKPITDIQSEVSQYFIKNFMELGATDILLFGAIGTGKSYISCAFAINAIAQKQIRVKYITEYDLLSLYFEKKYQEFKNFKESEILILDEIGKRVLADWQRIQLEELLSHRYNQQLPTIYITNLEQEAFREFLGARLADRLKENKLKRFAFNGDSLRG